MSTVVDLGVSSAPTYVGIGGGGLISQAVDCQAMPLRIFGLLVIGDTYSMSGASIRFYAQESDDGSTWQSVASFPLIDENTPAGSIYQISFVRTKRYVRTRGYTITQNPGAVIGIVDYYGGVQ